MIKFLFNFVLLILALSSLAQPLLASGEKTAKTFHRVSTDDSAPQNLNHIALPQSERGGVVERILCRTRLHDYGREKFTKATCGEFDRKYDSKYNVMVFNNEQPSAYNLRGVRENFVRTYCGIPYKVFVFRSGKFRNKGDGGFINWCFQGNFRRDGGLITFSKR